MSGNGKGRDNRKRQQSLPGSGRNSKQQRNGETSNDNGSG